MLEMPGCHAKANASAASAASAAARTAACARDPAQGGGGAAAGASPGRGSGTLGGARGLFGRLRAVQQLDQRHRRVVALPEAELEDAQVPAVARLVARPQLVEELHDHVAVAQAVEGEALVGERRV